MKTRRGMKALRVLLSVGLMAQALFATTACTAKTDQPQSITASTEQSVAGTKGANVHVNPSTRKTGPAVSWHLVPTDVSKWTVEVVQGDKGTKTSKPAVKVSADGYQLTEGYDYELEYSDTEDGETTTVTVVGKNGFSGTKTVSTDASHAGRMMSKGEGDEE